MNNRIADDKLACSRFASIKVASSDKLTLRPPAISLRAFQNGSSRLTLVVWPLILTERLTTVDRIRTPITGNQSLPTPIEVRHAPLVHRKSSALPPRCHGPFAKTRRSAVVS